MKINMAGVIIIVGGCVILAALDLIDRLTK